MSTESNSVEIDARAVIRVLEQTHPDAVRAAMWQVRATLAEDRERVLQATLDRLSEKPPADGEPAESTN